jgi:hypothetical protein
VYREKAQPQAEIREAEGMAVAMSAPFVPPHPVQSLASFHQHLSFEILIVLQSFINKN